jgi:hypothetical protein
MSAPWARFDHQDLLWLLDGRKLAALTTDTAIIATPSGGNLTYRRIPTKYGRVLAWELAAEGTLPCVIGASADLCAWSLKCRSSTLGKTGRIPDETRGDLHR